VLARSRRRHAAHAPPPPPTLHHTLQTTHPSLKHDALLSTPPDTSAAAQNDSGENATAAATKQQQPFRRAALPYRPLGERFLALPGAPRAFDRQYAQIYFGRYARLEPVVRARAERRWPGVPVKKILAVEEGEECAVVGTLYKDMKLKPSILDDYSKDALLAASLAGAVPGAGAFGENYCGEGDALVLEDDGARMALRPAAAADGSPPPRPPLDVDALVTGVVVALRGTAEPGGDFVVTDVCYAGLAAPQAPWPGSAAPAAAPAATTTTTTTTHCLPASLRDPSAVPDPKSLEAELAPRPDDAYIALVSGLALGAGATGGCGVVGGAGAGAGGSFADPLRLQQLVDWLTGCLGAAPEQSLASRVAHLIVAGGTVGALDALAAGGGGGAGGAGGGPGSGGPGSGSGAGAATAAPSARGAAGQAAAAAAALRPVRDADMLLAELASALPVDVMPGADDPCASVALPQPPLHPVLLPGASRFSSLGRAPNPCEVEVGGLRLLGTSGQNVDDIDRYSRRRPVGAGAGAPAETGGAAARLDAAVATLRWAHVAPTAPDTLACHPGADDPFVLAGRPESAVPHVYFVGNQPAFATAVVREEEEGGEKEGEGGSNPKAVRVVLVPSFARTGQLVLLNARTLACHTVTFGGYTAAPPPRE
jgi:DNA polymerase delta subunit 2